MKTQIIGGLIVLLSCFLLPGVLATETYSLTACSDSDDGDDPHSPGKIVWEFNSTGKSTGGGTHGDLCSGLHYTNAFLYYGIDIPWGESVLVEGVCPTDLPPQEESGYVQRHTKKYYICDCENLGEGGKGAESKAICKNTPKEVPLETAIAADEAWWASGKKEVHPALARFLLFFGLWG